MNGSDTTMEGRGSESGAWARKLPFLPLRSFRWCCVLGVGIGPPTSQKRPTLWLNGELRCLFSYQSKGYPYCMFTIHHIPSCKSKHGAWRGNDVGALQKVVSNTRLVYYVCFSLWTDDRSAFRTSSTTSVQRWTSQPFGLNGPREFEIIAFVPSVRVCCCYCCCWVYSWEEIYQSAVRSTLVNVNNQTLEWKYWWIWSEHGVVCFDTT